MPLISHTPGDRRFGRQELLAMPTPDPTDTHRPVAHSTVIQALIEALAYRKIDVVNDEYAVSVDSMQMFGFLEVNIEDQGIRLALGVRNSHNKTFALGLTVGYRVFICSNLAFHGDFMAVSKKHSKNMNVQEVLTIGVDRAQRHFAPMQQEINVWRNHNLPDTHAKSIICDAFLGRGIDAPQHLGKDVLRHYLAPAHEEFQPRTLWSLSNAFTSAFAELDAVPQMKAAASLGPFLKQYN